MYKINQITNDALQKHSVVVPETGIKVELTIYFIPMQYSWVIRELSYDGFILKNIRIVNGFNMLHQHLNKLPFGLACLSKGNREPSLQEDFQENYSELLILDSSEVEEYKDFISEG